MKDHTRITSMMTYAGACCLLLGVIVLPIAVSPLAAQAVSLRFDSIHANPAANETAGEALIGLEVTDTRKGREWFRLNNDGPKLASVTRIHFDGDILSRHGFSPEFPVDAETRVRLNGLAPREDPDGLFALQAGMDFADMRHALNHEDLRIALHDPGFSRERSEAHLNAPLAVASTVPALPTMLLILGSAMLGMAAILRRKGGAREVSDRPQAFPGETLFSRCDEGRAGQSVG